MCGIYANICRNNPSELCTNKKFPCIRNLLQNRGPDAYSEVNVSFPSWSGFFAGSTLWTQGPKAEIQPRVASNGSVFLWNGDKHPNNDLSEQDNFPIENDTDDVLSKILCHGVEYLMSINGPYAFIYYNTDKKELWFGRDVLGRHSLLWSLKKDVVEISSVGPSSFSESGFTEVPSCGLFKINFSNPEICLMMHPWSHLPEPNLINVEIPFFTKETLGHKTLKQNFGDNWIDHDPNDSEIMSFSENTGSMSAMRSSPPFDLALKNSRFSNIVDNLKNLLFKSVEKRIKLQPKFCKNCILLKKECKHAKLGILFSGGLDSAVIALISNTFVKENEPIDLYNVSFQRTPESDFNNVPDRITGWKTLEELKYLCPRRKWNFVEINVTKKELDEKRQSHISKLISPLTSIIDDSLGCALWFAARGEGLVSGNIYKSPSRIVLLGMGADEMFGGYSKHRKAFSNEGWRGLGKELCASLTQIGERNLGRDNRVVADHGRQPRTPYLDEDLVAYVNSLPPWERCFLPPKMRVGIGDKFILRVLAWKLGLENAAKLPKKALQFGSHIANPKEKGHLTSDRIS